MTCGSRRTSISSSLLSLCRCAKGLCSRTCRWRFVRRFCIGTRKPQRPASRSSFLKVRGQKVRLCSCCRYSFRSCRAREGSDRMTLSPCLLRLDEREGSQERDRASCGRDVLHVLPVHHPARSPRNPECSDPRLASSQVHV